MPAKNHTTKAKGLIHQKQSFKHFDLRHLQPSEDLACFVEHYWVITWCRQGQPAYTQYNLPHPSQHLVIDPQATTGVFGVQEGRFAYTLKDSGRIFGVKFWPGAFHAFHQKPVSQITNKHIKIDNVFNVNNNELEQAFAMHENPTATASNIESLLREMSPKLTEKASLTRSVVEFIEENKEMVSVQLLAEEFNTATRTLQRLFDTYIGVSPKWVIDRYRIIEAVNMLNNEPPVNLTDLSCKLGYYDLAHFSKVFFRLVGCLPSNYNCISLRQK